LVDYQGNSKSSKASGKPTERKEKLQKVVTGPVLKKDKSVGRKFKDVFFGGDAKQATLYVASDILLPALRNLVVDMITRGTERLIYGDRVTPRRDSRTNYGAQYTISGSPRLSFDPRDPRQTSIPSIPPRGRGVSSRHEVGDVIVGTKAEADLVVEQLCNVLETYEVVSLADLNELLGLETSHIDYKWGWTFIHNVPIRQTRNGYLIELPPLEEI